MYYNKAEIDRHTKRDFCDNFTGTYEICIDNRPGIVAKKLVYFYFATIVEEEATEFREAVEAVHQKMVDFAVSVPLI